MIYSTGEVLSYINDNDKKIIDFFQRVVTGTNFCTPCIIDYLKIGRFIMEISVNNRDDAYFKDAYGVSVVNADEKKQDYDLSKCCQGKDELNEYLEYLETIQNEEGVTNASN